MILKVCHVVEIMAGFSKFENNWVLSPFSSATEESVEMCPSALLQQKDNSTLLGIFILDRHGEMGPRLPPFPTKQLLLCSPCCVSGSGLYLGVGDWFQTENKVNVAWFWLQM